MTRSRFVLFGLGLLCLGAAGAAVYLYYNLPALVRSQALSYLQQYGIDAFEYQGLHLTQHTLSVDELSLRGIYGDFSYQVQLTSATVHYHWRALLRKKLDSLALSSVDITITHNGTDSRSGTAGVINIDTLLPNQWIAQRPVGSVVIPNWSVHYRLPDSRLLNATGALNLDEQLRAQIVTTQAGTEIAAVLESGPGHAALNLDMVLGDTQPAIAALSANLVRTDAKDWEWRIGTTAHYAPLLAWVRKLDAEHALALPLPAASDLTIEGDSELTVIVRHPNELDFAAPPDSPDAAWRQLAASYDFNSSVRQLTINGVVNTLNGSLDGSGSLAAGQFKVAIQPFAIAAQINTQSLALPESSLQWLGWTDSVPLQLQTHEPAHLAAIGSDSWSLRVENAALSLGEKNSRASLQTHLLESTVRNTGQMAITAQLNSSLSTRLRGQTLPQLNTAVNQHGTIEHSEITLRLSDTAESVQADLTGTGNFSSGAGSFQLQATITDLPYFTSITVPLLHHFDLLEDTLAVRAGSIRLETALQSQSFDLSQWEQRSQLTFENISGEFNDYSFEGLALSADWSGISHWNTLQPLQLSISTLSPGFPVQQIHVLASLPQVTPIAAPKVRLDAFSATMFGGEVVLPTAQTWDFGASSNQLTLQARQWQLGEIVALQQNKDIQAQGTLEGELPLTISNGRIIIDTGFLRALPPGGWIRYRPDEENGAVAESSSELALALDLLDDFQYQVLNSEVHLDEAGTLSLDLSLEGNNPGYYDGQAVNFNIHLEQNLDPLLQSLRLSDNLVNKIEGGLQ